MGFERILAFTDLSTTSCTGLSLAEVVARRYHSRVTVGYVHTRLDVLRDFGGGDENTARLRQWVRTEDDDHLHAVALRYIEKLRLAGVETVECDSAREGVELLMRRTHPDLVCMATHGRTGLKSVLLGSVAEHTIRTAETPVIVTKGTVLPAPEEHVRVLLGVDLIDDPTRLVRRVARLLRSGDELILAHVVESMYLSLAAYGTDFALPQPDVPRLERAAHEKLEGIRIPGTSRPKIRVEVRVGKPAEALLKLERETKPHLIVVRTHGRRGFDHLMLGSVSERMARKCRAPVLVFPKLG